MAEYGSRKGAKMKVFKIVAVKDELTESFLQPTFIENIEEAERLFKYQINNIPLWKDNASDYSLYYLGTYDSETGIISSTGLSKIASGHTMLRKENTGDILDFKKTTEK